MCHLLAARNVMSLCGRDDLTVCPGSCVKRVTVSDRFKGNDPLVGVTPIDRES
jgi:hypothetical protein